MSRFVQVVTAAGIELTAAPEATGWISQFLSRDSPVDLSTLPRSDASLMEAFAELRELGESGGVSIEPDRITLSHQVMSYISDTTAATLELPPTVDLLLKLEVDGQIGSPSFSLKSRWLDGGSQVVVRRIGAVLETGRGKRRLPAPLLRAVLEAERVTDGTTDLATHWERLAMFRNSLEPEATDPSSLPDFAERVAMTSFLEGMTLQACSALAIGTGSSADDFDPIPFPAVPNDSKSETSEVDGLVRGTELSTFQQRFRARGATPAYRLGDGKFLILTPGVLPLARLMEAKQQATTEQRREFILNPEPFVREAYRRERLSDAEYDESEDVMGAAELEELEEGTVAERLVITVEHRDRVIGSGLFERPDLSEFGAAPFSTTWLPEEIAELAKVLAGASDMALEEFAATAETALRGAAVTELPPQPVVIGGTAVPPEQVRVAVAAEQDTRANKKPGDTSEAPLRAGPTVLLTETNFSEVDWHPETVPRGQLMGDTSITNVSTSLMAHQRCSVDWGQRAWLHGLPGVLNADEQGLGKTLQTLALLSWLHARMAAAEPESRLPFLIVAPTSLLRTWEQEIATHLEPASFANVIRLYGSGLAPYRPNGGNELQSGEATLDLSSIQAKVDEGRGHNRLLLTTYRTLANYHHSLHTLRFSALVFDEIQTLKNPSTIASAAARSVRADFRIGLTGTPIENKVQDLWAIMDQLSPGSFGSLRDYTNEFGQADRASLEALNVKLLDSCGNRPPIAIRRLKQSVASDLPSKRRVLMPAAMPTEQLERYDEARVKLAGSTGSALKAMHHIRSVSTHPGLVDKQLAGVPLEEQSARLGQVVRALDMIAARGERALVFVEARVLQYRLAEFLAVRYQLDGVDVINGNTSIPARQAIVTRFQEHLEEDRGFDVLVLGPRAAGTGLTLTAANHVLHMSRWWNPAVEEQCNDRVHRIGQRRDVTVHIPLAVHPDHGPASFDCLLQRLMLAKRSLAEDVLAPMGEGEDDVSALQGGLVTATAEVPRFTSVAHLRQWAEERLHDYRERCGRGAIAYDASNTGVVIVQIVPSGAGTAHAIADGVSRTVRLEATAVASLVTTRDVSGTLDTRLSGPLLALWPEAVIEPSDAVRFVGPH